MNFDSAKHPLAPIDHGTRYHYSYGRKHAYGNPAAGMIYGPGAARYGTRSFSRNGAPARLDDGPQTVEQLVEQGYFAAPKVEAEMAILHDKKHTSWLGLDDILTQVRHRRHIYEKNMTDIEWAKCYAFNELVRGGGTPSDERYGVYKRRLQDLHAEQRAERAALWRDVSRLRQQLPESAQQYLSASRKLDIIGDTDGDAP
ncbi:MAG: hypothetical protein J5J06_15935 [Phycisphaerae bacterium]|nr:hypothetical protein [Phycisphaerae bacterium]